eukprot:jgi/Undpi1/2797/HiC_scaffold_14.g06174.m1
MGRRSHMETTVQQPLPLSLKRSGNAHERQGYGGERTKLVPRVPFRACFRLSVDLIRQLLFAPTNTIQAFLAESGAGDDSSGHGREGQRPQISLATLSPIRGLKAVGGISSATKRRQERRKKEERASEVRAGGRAGGRAGRDTEPWTTESDSVTTRSSVEHRETTETKARGASRGGGHDRDFLHEAHAGGGGGQGGQGGSLPPGGVRNAAVIPPSPGSALKPDSFDYLTIQDIRPSPNPTQELQRAMSSLPRDTWPEIFHTLNSVRRLAVHHAALLGSQSHLHALVRDVLGHVENLRSQVAKNALLTLTDLWRGLGGALDPELPMVCPVLVKKLADKVEFLAEAAREDGNQETRQHAKALVALLLDAGEVDEARLRREIPPPILGRLRRDLLKFSLPSGPGFTTTAAAGPAGTAPGSTGCNRDTRRLFDSAGTRISDSKDNNTRLSDSRDNRPDVGTRLFDSRDSRANGVGARLSDNRDSRPDIGTRILDTRGIRRIVDGAGSRLCDNRDPSTGSRIKDNRRLSNGTDSTRFSDSRDSLPGNYYSPAAGVRGGGDVSGGGGTSGGSSSRSRTGGWQEERRPGHGEGLREGPALLSRTQPQLRPRLRGEELIKNAEKPRRGTGLRHTQEGGHDIARKSRSPYESSDVAGSVSDDRRRTGAAGAGEVPGRGSTGRRSTSPPREGAGARKRSSKAFFCREAELLPGVFANLDSSDWRERVKGLDEIPANDDSFMWWYSEWGATALLGEHGDELYAAGKSARLVDRMSELLADGNLKVNLHALDGVVQVASTMADKLEPVANTLIPAVCKNLASSNQQRVALAEEALDALCQAVDPCLMVQPVASLAQYGNARLKVPMLALLRDLTPVVGRVKPTLLPK